MKKQRLKQLEYRPREYLKPAEMDLVLEAARKSGRHADRNFCMVLLGYRHGLRVTELCGMTWDQIDLDEKQIRIERLKGSNGCTQMLEPDEVAALKKMKSLAISGSRYVFPSQQGLTMTRIRFGQIMAEIGRAAKLDFSIHPHNLRHSCGFYLANKKKADAFLIKELLGHKSIQNTTNYCRMSPERFRGLWDK